MSYTVQKPLPRAQVILSQLPLDPVLEKQVRLDQQEICDILESKDPRKILIIGPCSAWPDDAVIEYARRLKSVEEKVSDKLKIVLRTYLQKPRTTIGWLGPLNQPDPFADADIEAGIYYCRKMMMECVEIGLPLADEALFTHNDSYFVDLLSWVAIGARSAEDQEHRIWASMCDHPVGIKNTTAGEVSKGINSIIAAQHSHVFAIHREQVQTSGNPHAHLILRGGNGTSNYNRETVAEAIELMEKKNIQNPSIIVDASHDNSINPETGKKDPSLQPNVIEHVVEYMKDDPSMYQHIKGFMVESFLNDGNQSVGKFNSAAEMAEGVSITDGCLGWDKTEKMILDLAAQL